MSLILIAITSVKLLLAAVWGGTADIPQTFNQAQAFLAGRDLLDPASTGGNPSFFPIGHYLIASCGVFLSEWTHLPFSFWIKTPAIFADLGVAWLLRSMPRGGNRAAFLYMFNPVTFLLSVYHGQLHTVAMAAAVFAYWCADGVPQAELMASATPPDAGRHPAHPMDDAKQRVGGRWRDQAWAKRSGIALGIAASVRQHFAVLLLPLAIRSRKGRIALLFTFGITALLINIPLLRSAHLQRILFPTWTYGSWGYTMVMQHSPKLLGLNGQGATSILGMLNHAVHAYGPLFYLLWAIGFVIWSIRSRSDDHWTAALLFLLGIYVISPGFGVQWLVWVVPFWLIVNQWQALGYSLVAGAFLIGSYWQWSLNAKYGVEALTANLHVLSRGDLIGVMLVGTCGVLTWLYALRAAWRLVRLKFPGHGRGILNIRRTYGASPDRPPGMPGAPAIPPDPLTDAENLRSKFSI